MYSSEVYSEKISIDETRYKLLFSFENAYGIFRFYNDDHNIRDSRAYKLISYQKINHPLSPSDILEDVFLLCKTNKLKLNQNDVICIKLNGEVVSYRFLGFRGKNINCIDPAFSRLDKFIDAECDDILSRLHKQNRVLSVLDGKSYNIENLDLSKLKLYSIARENFGSLANFSSAKNGFSEFSIFALDDLSIKRVDIYKKPFFSLRNALFSFQKMFGSQKKSLLLFDRKELEMIKDYYECKSLGAL